MSIIDDLKSAFLGGFLTSVAQGAKNAKRTAYLFILKIILLVLGAICLILGLLLLGANYLGLQWMLLGIGIILLAIFFMIK